MQKLARQQIKMIGQKLIRMLPVDFILSQCVFRKVFKVLGHNHVATTYNSSRQYMTIIGIWQVQSLDKVIIARYERGGDCLIHQRLVFVPICRA